MYRISEHRDKRPYVRVFERCSVFSHAFPLAISLRVDFKPSLVAYMHDGSIIHEKLKYRIVSSELDKNFEFDCICGEPEMPIPEM